MQRTTDLLNRQATLIGQMQSVKNNYGLPIYKSSKQIKKENYELKHQKTVTRVLKMHSVMPRMLRKVTEPPKAYAKDFSIDVEKRVQQALDEYNMEKKQRQEAKGTSFYKEKSMDHIPSVDNNFFGISEEKTDLQDKDVASTLKLHQKQSSGHQRSNTIIQKASRNTNILTPSQNSSYRISQRRQKNHILEVGAPQGAQVIMDGHAIKQLDAISKGVRPSTSDLKNGLATALLQKVDKQAINRVVELRRKMSMIKFSGDSEQKDIANIQFLEATKVQAQTHSLVKKRPQDKVQMIENKVSVKDRRREKVGHSHFVKMSFEQLPFNMQQRVLQSNNQSQDENSSHYHSRHNSACNLSERQSQQLLKRPNSSVPRNTMRKSVKGSTDRIMDRKGIPVNQTKLTSKFDHPSAATQRNRLSVDYDRATTADQSTSAQQDSQRLLGNALNKLSHTRRTTTSAFDSASMATICEQEDVEATILQPQKSSFYANKNHAAQTQRRRKTAINANFMGTKMHKKNDSLFQVRKHAQNNSRVSQMIESLPNKHPYSKQSYQDIKQHSASLKSIHGPPASSISQTRFTTGSRKPRPSGSISNLPIQTVERLTKHLTHRSRHSGAGFSPMKQKICSDDTTEVPKELGDNVYLVKKQFHYERPKRFRIEFAKPAVFINGCLTCGNEHVKVENYGERHCCSTCQKSLQTKEGENVTLRVSQNGRFIIPQAWRYSKLVKGLKVDIDDLRIRGGHKCHATFAGERGDIIVLLDEVNENFVYM